RHGAGPDRARRGRLRVRDARLVRRLRAGGAAEDRDRRAGRARRPRRRRRGAARDGDRGQVFRDGRARRQGRAAPRPAAPARAEARRGCRGGAGASPEASRGGERPREGAAAAMNVVKAVGWRKLRFRFDWTLTLSALTVAGLGLVNLWSAVHDRQANLFSQQISWLGLGAAVFLGVATVDYRHIARLGYVFYGVGVALLLAVALFGKSVGGGQRWVDLGPFHVQPSELMQLLTVVALGRYLNDSPALEGRSWRHMAIPVALVSAPVLLIAKQPDFGTAFLLLLTFFSIMMTARLKVKTLAVFLLLATIAALARGPSLLHGYQLKRVEAFLNPNSEGAYQARQALNAIGSGRFLGKGFMHGTQIRLRHFPALWTDFPFAVWAEEWGFVGCFVLLL